MAIHVIVGTLPRMKKRSRKALRVSHSRHEIIPSNQSPALHPQNTPIEQPSKRSESKTGDLGRALLRFRPRWRCSQHRTRCCLDCSSIEVQCQLHLVQTLENCNSSSSPRRSSCSKRARIGQVQNSEIERWNVGRPSIKKKVNPWQCFVKVGNLNIINDFQGVERGFAGHAYDKEYFANQCLSAGDSNIPYKFLRLLRHLPSHHLPHRALSRLNPGLNLQPTLAIRYPPHPHPSQQVPGPPHRRLRPGSTAYCLTAKSSPALPASP
jgi:hypothetical protein